MNPQTTTFIVKITGAIGWVVAFIFFANYRWKKEKHRILVADHKALGKKYCRVSTELKNLQYKTAEPFKERPKKIKFDLTHRS